MLAPRRAQSLIAGSRFARCGRPAPDHDVNLGVQIVLVDAGYLIRARLPASSLAWHITESWATAEEPALSRLIAANCPHD